jgi:phage baseplate assembly protein V
VIDLVNRMLAPLRIRVANMIARAVVQLVDDTTKMQLVQLGVLADETRTAERFQSYGFTSVPLPGAEAVVVFPGGRRDHGLAIAVEDRRYRIRNLQSGEVAVYTDQGDSIVIKRGGTIQVTAATKVIVSAPAVELAQPAAHPVAMGDTLNTAIATLGTSIATAITGLGSAGPALPVLGAVATTAGTAVTTAVTAFQTAATAALSTKVKTG